MLMFKRFEPGVRRSIIVREPSEPETYFGKFLDQMQTEKTIHWYVPHAPNSLADEHGVDFSIFVRRFRHPIPFQITSTSDAVREKRSKPGCPNHPMMHVRHNNKLTQGLFTFDELRANFRPLLDDAKDFVRNGGVWSYRAEQWGITATEFIPHRYNQFRAEYGRHVSSQILYAITHAQK